MREKAICLHVKDLAKTYKKRGGGLVHALQGVSFEVPKGEVFTILGPNGAGKTTLLRILTTLLKPDRGDALLEGVSLKKQPLKVRENLGVVFQANHFNNYLTVWDNLLLHADMHGLPRKHSTLWLKDQLALADLTGRETYYPDQFSGGQQRRMAIIRALMHQPTLLFLDEPTTGLDPEARKTVWQQIQTLQDQGTTVILTTHYMDEAEYLSDSILLLKEGRVLRYDAPDKIKALLHEQHRFELHLWSHEVPREEGRLLFQQLAQQVGVIQCLPVENEDEAWVRAFELASKDVWPNLVAQVPPAWLHTARWQTPSLAQVFMKLSESDDSPAASAEGVA